MNRRTYDGWGYSPLDQITPDNVSRLRPVWVFSTNDGKPHESAPLVNNGVMFVTSPANQVLAIDVKSGNLLWRYKPSRPAGSSSVIFNDTNRGVALYEDKVYYALPEAVLVALNAKTGKEVWRTTIADYKTGYYVTLAPLVADGKVMVGASGGESGIRGFIAAFSADTGKEIWRTFTIPAPGEPGSETWPKGDQWKPRRHAGLGHRQLRPARPILPTGELEIPGLISATSAQATIYIVARRWCSMSLPARSKAISNTTPTTRGIGTRFRRPSWSTISATDKPSRG